ncbi:inactive serine/threonine-protein kinase TEX14 [Hemitrygon akajei]|uniref:inactive serine/threonine-protein kinase TEX14 n=1 Tax=Hemitrygon akajei TaxID=2704970 RepID=UPI003BFA1013
MTLSQGCPERLGSTQDLDGDEALLHLCARRGSRRQMERLLAQGCPPDVRNSAGESPLYVAATRGHSDLVHLLLSSGANPNLRCHSGSTPVHAATFSCLPDALATLLDTGGDLRLHDSLGRSPEDWARAAGSPKNRKVLELLSRYQARMSQLIRQSESVRGLTLLRSCSSAPLLQYPSCPRLPLPHLRTSRSDVGSSAGTHSFGFGKLCQCGRRGVGVLGSVPVLGDRDLHHTDSEPDISYPNGPLTRMCNWMWEGQRVTVRELKPPRLSHSHSQKGLCTSDLLVTELEHCSHLYHPNLLLLMAVCLSESLAQLRLVYQRVGLGSLYIVLHQQRAATDGLGVREAVPLLSQICEALLFLHSRGYLHRSLTSHAVQLVGLGQAKLGNLEYLQERAEDEHGARSRRATAPPAPHQLYNWLPPEIISGLVGSERSDLYSFCALTQEVFTGMVPWAGAGGKTVRQMMASGRSLSLDPHLSPSLRFALRLGTSPKPQHRTLTLRDVHHTLHRELQEGRPSPEAQKGQGERWDCRDPWGKLEAQDGAEWESVRSWMAQSEGGLSYCEVERDTSSQTKRHPYDRGLGAEGGEPSRGIMRLKGRGGSVGEEGSLKDTANHGHRRLDHWPSPSHPGLRVYSVRRGRELDPITDGSLPILWDSESSLWEMETECPEESPPPGYTQQPSISQDAAHPAPIHPRDSRLLSCASSIRESAGLLGCFNSSLERLEQRFLSGIQALEQVTNRQWEDEQETHHIQPRTGTHMGTSSVEFQQSTDNTDSLSTILEDGALVTAGDGESQSSSQKETTQATPLALTALVLLERWNLCHPTSISSSSDDQQSGFDLMQEMIDELKQQPTAAGISERSLTQTEGRDTLPFQGKQGSGAGAQMDGQEQESGLDSTPHCHPEPQPQAQTLGCHKEGLRQADHQDAQTLAGKRSTREPGGHSSSE